MINDALRSVVRVCHAGLDTVTLRKELSLRVGRVLPFDAYAFSTTDPDTGLLRHTVASGVPEAAMAAYATHFYPWEAATITIDAGWSEDPIFALWECIPELQAAMHANGLNYDVHVTLADRTGFWGDWCLMREQRVGSIEAERRFLQRARPHIVQALRNGALIDLARDASCADADHPTACVIVLDSRLRVSLRAGSADAIFDDLADVGVHAPGRIPGSIVNAAARVRRRHVSTTEAVLRVRGRSARWYTVRAMLAEPDHTGDSSVVVVVRPIATREKAVLLTRLYGLSDREREVSAAVARGESTKQIAAGLRISPHTVKEHLDRACAKIGVHGRKALVAHLFLDGYAHERPN